MPNCFRCGNSGAENVTSESLCVCDECVSTLPSCQGCGCIVSGVDPRLANTPWLCPECADLVTCQECGRRMRNIDNEVCERCARNNGDGDGDELPGHGFAPRQQMFLVAKGEKRHPDTLFFGIEIEVENVLGREQNTVAARRVRDKSNGALYFKHDGSLSHGFEIVSHPFTWAWLNSKEGRRVLQGIWSLKDHGFRAYDTSTAGMHVHMSKEAFTRVQLYRFLQLHYAHPELVELVSRRQSSDSLQQWASPHWGRGGGYGSRDQYDTVAKVARDKGRGGARYHAVNLTNGRTVEVRIFRSTLRYSGFRQRIEWCKAAFDFSAQCSIQEAQDGVAFLDWLAKHRSEYRVLAKFLLDTRGEQVREIARGRVELPRSRVQTQAQVQASGVRVDAATGARYREEWRRRQAQELRNTSSNFINE